MATVWVVVKIGCLECDQDTTLLGVFTDWQKANHLYKEVKATISSKIEDVVMYQAELDGGVGRVVGERLWAL